MSTVSRPEVVRGRVTDPLVVGLIALAVVAAHGYDGGLSRDMGVFTYGGLHVLAGIPPYVGIFNSVGPLADLVPALGIWLGRLVDLGPVLSERLLFSVITAASCALVYVLARDVLRSRAAGFVAAATLLTFRSFLVLGAGGPRDKTTMVLFLVATLVLVVRRHWLAAGAGTALATLAWQPVLLPACVAALVGVAAVRTGRLRAGGLFLLGGMIPSAVAVAYFASQHALRVAFEGFLLVNLDYTHQPSLIDEPHQILALLVRGYGWTLWLAAAGLVALAVLSVVALARRPRDVGVLVVGAGGLAAVTWTVLVINGAPDLFVVLPFAAVGVAGAVAAVTAHLSTRSAWAVAGIVTTAATVAAGSEAVVARNNDLAQQQADVSAVLEAAPTTHGLVSFNAPEVLALAGRSNLSPFQIFDESKDQYLQHMQPGGLPGYAAWVDGMHPDLIAVRTTHLPVWATPLRHDYEAVGTGPGWSWFVARSDGIRVAAQVRAANWSVMHGGSGTGTSATP